MALAVNGSGTIFKKCDRSNHRPDSNKGCASSTCQHTCDTPERCPHAWTLRYWVNGKQVEKSFKDKQHPHHGARGLRQRQEARAGAARFPGVLLSRGPLRACCYRSGSAAAARSRATDPAMTRAHPMAILGLRRCTARATQGT